MKNLIYKIFPFVFIVILLNSNITAQQNNTLYFMDKIPQASLMNPANQPYCKFYLGLPVLSSIYFNYGNNGFAYNDLLYLNDAGKLIFDPDNFFEGLQDVNNISFDTEFNLFALGFKLGDMYFSLNAAQKNDFAFTFPKGVFGIILEGNGKHLGDDYLDLSGFGTNINIYSEISLGLTRKINDVLSVGLRGKYYIGVLNVTTEKSDVRWYTDEDFYDWRFTSDMSFNIASPVPINLTDTTQDIGFVASDSIMTEDFLKFENTGFGVDLGASYAINRQLTVSASLVDLGSIKWKTNTQNFKSDAEFEWTGFDVTPLISGEEIDYSKFADSLIQGFNFSEESNTYKTKIPTKLYLGASYFLNDNWGFGVLFRSKFYENMTFSSLTLSASTGLGNILGLTGSYSLAYNSFNNFGLGLNLKLAFFQFYLVSDNVYGMLFPQNTRNINLRFGLNIIIGCKYHKKDEKAKKGKDMIRQQQEIDPALFY